MVLNGTSLYFYQVCPCHIVFLALMYFTWQATSNTVFSAISIESLSLWAFVHFVLIFYFHTIIGKYVIIYLSNYYSLLLACSCI